MTDEEHILNEVRASAVINFLLTLDPADRADTLSYIRFNNIFCEECGEGSMEKPNPDCQCWNDE